MDKLSSIMHRALRRRGMDIHVDAAHVAYCATRWLEEHLPHLCADIRVTRFQDGVLCIACAHSVALQECRGEEANLLRFLQQECPLARVSSMRLMRE